MKRALVVACALMSLAVAACSQPEESPGSVPVPTIPTHSIPPTPTPSPTPTTPPTPEPPAWLGTRVLPEAADGYGQVLPTPAELDPRAFSLPDTLDPLPGSGFASQVEAPAPDHVIDRSTWSSSCPIGRQNLAWVRLTFWGFDDARHTGELLLDRRVADAVVRAFADLYAAKFPIEQMRITSAAELDLPPTGDGNNTESFVCRPVTGGSGFSQHAYGRAVDINPFQNPYIKGSRVLPELSSAYLDRSNVRPGMITANGPAVQAFSAIGWGWGGTWRSLKDLHHFSANNK